ncbi:CHY_zinc finger-containing protein [Hexamita inflata]|uniref:CHY zinc finger-containing protein n=1 Tax=Hexamita inflata TaxID=28002 RepID=A0AA86QBZ9_9EUKA|nr:CHY zinc finger-containing protein [Hexamita inflata]CAI9950252.1 CHY zinc finger-containing protein [Hexamita inflata]
MNERYKEILIAEEMIGRHVQIHCNECNKNYVNKMHPGPLYLCPECEIYNCEVIDDTKEHQDQLQEQFEKQILQYPSIFVPEDGNEQNISKRLEQFYNTEIKIILEHLNIEFNEITLHILPVLINNGDLPKTLDELKELFWGHAEQLEQMEDDEEYEEEEQQEQ